MAGRADATIIRKAWKLRRGEKTQQQIADELGFGMRQVQNYLNSKWLADRNLGHLRYAEEPLQAPRSRIENEAWGFCQGGNHEWMDDDRYNGHAYKVEDVSEEMTGFEGSRLITVWRVRTCRFCGYNTRRRHFGYSIV